MVEFVHNLGREVQVTAYDWNDDVVGVMAVLEISDDEVEVWLAGGADVARLVAEPAE